MASISAAPLVGEPAKKLQLDNAAQFYLHIRVLSKDHLSGYFQVGEPTRYSTRTLSRASKSGLESVIGQPWVAHFQTTEF